MSNLKQQFNLSNSLVEASKKVLTEKITIKTQPDSVITPRNPSRMSKHHGQGFAQQRWRRVDRQSDVRNVEVKEEEVDRGSAGQQDATIMPPTHTADAGQLANTVITPISDTVPGSKEQQWINIEGIKNYLIKRNNRLQVLASRRGFGGSDSSSGG